MMTERLHQQLRRLDEIPATDVWPRVRLEGNAPPPIRKPRRLLIALTSLAIAAAAFAFLVSAFPQDEAQEPSATGGAQSPPVPSSPGYSEVRVSLYASLLRVVATQAFHPPGPIYVRREICGVVVLGGLGSGLKGCRDAFSEVEQAELAERLASLGPVRFVGSFDEVGIGRDGSNPEAAIFVWVGPIERHGDELRAVGGMWCGGLCGQGGTFKLGPGQERWKLSHCCVSWIA
jgi:hypothetical protein